MNTSDCPITIDDLVIRVRVASRIAKQPAFSNATARTAYMMGAGDATDSALMSRATNPGQGGAK